MKKKTKHMLTNRTQYSSKDRITQEFDFKDKQWHAIIMS